MTSSSLLRHEEPRSRDASLTAVQKGDPERRRDGFVEIGVIEQDVGRFAAQLERDALHRRGTVVHDRLADGSRTREGDLGHVGIAHEFGPDDITAARDDVAKTLREVCRVHALQPHPRLQSAHLAGLHDHRAAGGDG